MKHKFLNVNIPQAAIDTLPDGFVILGWGQPSNDSLDTTISSIVWSSFRGWDERVFNNGGYDPNLIYAIPSPSFVNDTLKVDIIKVLLKAYYQYEAVEPDLEPDERIVMVEVASMIFKLQIIK